MQTRIHESRNNINTVIKIITFVFDFSPIIWKIQMFKTIILPMFYMVMKHGLLIKQWMHANGIWKQDSEAII